MERVNIIIFARAPYVGAVKTRLAKSIGAHQARKIYQQTLDRAIAAAHAASRTASHARAFVAWTPDNIFFRQGFFALPPLRQGHGDLGFRLTRLAKKMAPVIFIGSDSLAMTAQAITTAIRGLKTHDVVIAPAGDGGYSLIGINNGALPVFKNIRWSHAQTLADTLAAVRHKRVLRLPVLPDIDEVSDLHKARQKLC